MAKKKTKKRATQLGRPPHLDPRTSPTTVRLEPQHYEFIVDWQHKHRLPSFVAALRSMIEFAAKNDSKKK